MRELNNKEIEGVSGGSLTSVILDFFKQLGASSEEKTEWTRPDSIPVANPVSGSAFGMGIVGVAAAVVFGLLIF
ncbi:hypothetical protein [Pantoea agglomerans]|uniref:hypothetical protein n=1 Tax=Enterobacter agglomerans TaxID=549 RepID=UPI003C7B1142